MRNIGEIAKEVLREYDSVFVWYGNPEVCQVIRQRALEEGLARPFRKDTTRPFAGNPLDQIRATLNAMERHVLSGSKPLFKKSYIRAVNYTGVRETLHRAFSLVEP